MSKLQACRQLCRDAGNADAGAHAALQLTGGAVNQNVFLCCVAARMCSSQPAQCSQQRARVREADVGP